MDFPTGTHEAAILHEVATVSGAAAQRICANTQLVGILRNAFPVFDDSQLGDPYRNVIRDRGLDHLVVAARTLDEGCAWVRERLGVAPSGGGKHATMGTHNRVMKLDAGRYLEVIAIDPEAPSPSRPRWFDLDSPAMQARLARGPALIHWVERTDDLEGALRARPERVEILAFSRGPYRWRMGVARDGRMPANGAAPTLIQWEGEAHPWDALPDSGCALVQLSTAQGALSATFATPAGTRTIP